VDTAVDVAREAADFVLLKPDLDVLRRGIEEGRTTFANTMKYVYTTTSSSFGNMFSMAGASLFLPFLPLLAKQVLFQNLLSDIPMMAIASDNVDQELVNTPHRWDIRFIRNFMIIFGLISSVFDYITFGVLIFLLRATTEQFRTGWFVESMLTELFIILVVRTRRPAFRSTPGKLLWITTMVITLITIIIPYLPISRLMGFVPLPLSIMLTMLFILISYLAASEAAKRIYFRQVA
jgi:Mg2+-importing ATPase